MYSRHATPWYKKVLIHVFFASFLAGFLPMSQVAEALSIMQSLEPVSNLNPGGGLPEIRSVGSVETRYGLVAILVSEEVWEASTSESGTFSFFGASGLEGKIQTYAQDVQATLPWTKTVIVTVSEDDTPVEIQRMLERFYFEGNPEDSDPTKLSGVVMVGDVPLPVVNKSGHRFISLLPYTDFEEPSYLLDVGTQDFLPNAEAQKLQAEVWHGVIVPPLDGQDGYDLLGAYFDKNHEFHTGNEDYTTFDEKVFVADLVTEEKTINNTSFGAYERYLNLWEELSYYRYTNDLVEDLFIDMQASVEAGDTLDNDDDGDVDEEAPNGIDDDSDGWVDEDNGDGFWGIDNDGDCYELSASEQDSNGDGKPCYKGVWNADTDEYDVKPDTNVDEDGFTDNNNDKGWIIELYAEGDADIFEDKMVDEDPPGDTTGGEDSDGDGFLDGDGCPGLCGVDDNGDAVDHDGDGYPTGIEILLRWDWTNERSPWPSVFAWTNNYFGKSFSEDENDEATEYLQAMFIDKFFDNEYKHDSCYEGSTYHPEWDDDEDGFCDEDGSAEVQLWVDDNATPGDGVCVYNDGDCDGQIDEDPLGLQPEGMFDDLPDIQAKSIVEGLIKRYAEIFQQPLGIWNRLVDQTGRYSTRVSDGESVTNDYDTAVSLIAKKDESVLQYLYELNESMEEKVNEIVEDDLAQDIPIIANLKITGTYDGEDICDPDGTTEDDDACFQFVNHSGFNSALFDDEGGLKDLDQLDAWDYYINGQQLPEITNVAECTNFAGTDEEDGQLAKLSSLYSREFAQDEDHKDMNVEEVEEYRNCIPEFEPYTDDIPDLCDSPTARMPTRTLDGAKVPEEGVDTSRWEVGAEACFEFRELETFDDYTQSKAEFNDWLTKKIRAFRKEDDSDEAESYEAFLDTVEEKMDAIADSGPPRPDEATLRKRFEEIDLITADSGMSYTMIDLLKELGYENPSDDDVDTFIGMIRDSNSFVSGVEDAVADVVSFFTGSDSGDDEEDSITIENPQEGSGMSDVESLTIAFDKKYFFVEILEDTSLSIVLADDYGDAEKISSVYKHTEPKADTLNAQITNAGSPNLPIDKTRRVSFIDNGSLAQSLNYVNVFAANEISDVEDDINRLAEDLGEVSGGSSFQGEVENFYDDINIDQLEDALEWRYLSIDEKHRYVLTHYLGTDEPIIAKARDGYEMMSLIADGSADELYFAFNGNKPETEEDLEFKYRSQEAIEAALKAAASTEEEEFEPLSELSNTTPVLLSEWLGAMEEWLKDVEDSLTSTDTHEEETYCGDKFEYTSGSTEDSDDNGVTDSAEATVSLRLSSDDNEVLQANGKDYYIVSVSAEKSDGSINTDDSSSEIELAVVSGESSIAVSGNSTLKLTGGVATFSLLSGEPGSFTLRAEPQNREDLSNSNALSGTVESKLVKVTTYITEEEEAQAATDVAVGTRIEVEDAEGTVVAILDPETGDLELRGVEAELREASSSLPTRVGIVSEAGETLGVFFIIPDEKDVSIGDGLAGVFVQEVGEDANAALAESGIALEDKGVEMGLVTALGQIAVSEGYQLEFENPEAINLYDPIHIVDEAGESVFTITIKHSFSEGSILTPENTYSDYLSGLYEWPRGKRGQVVKEESLAFFFKAALRAVAESVVPDSDEDSLDDLEEWTIGSDWEDTDTDGDSYNDGQEIFSGYDPLEAEGKLFTDITAEHEAYHDLAVLYLRGVIKGYSDGSFRPDNKITREEFVKVDLGAICKDCDSYSDEYEESLMTEYEKDPFPDADINSELLACVAEAKVEGIVSGYAGGSTAGYFVPTQYISRAEATKVLVETAGWEADELASKEAWYMGYVRTAEDKDLFPEGTTVTTSWLEASISRAEFVMMAVNLIEAQDCRAVDTDGEGLSDTEEEVLYNTDPLVADTDLGGVNDFDEVIRDSDPLDASDDQPESETTGPSTEEEEGKTAADAAVDETGDYSSLSDFDHEPGVYAVSETAAYEAISTSTGSGSATVNIYTNDVAADGESTLYVRAEIRDQDDNIYVDDNTSVIEFVLSSSEYGEMDSSRVQVSAGIAETVFRTTKVAGELTVEGLITDGSIPSENAEVHVYPGEPVRLELAGESTVLPAGGEADSDMKVYLYDSFGNLAYNGFYTVTLSTDGGLSLLDLNDEDADAEGTQVTTSDGYLNFRVLASADVGASTVSASLLEVEDSGDVFSIDHEEGMTLSIATSSPYMVAGGSSPQTVTVSVVNALGAYVTGFQGDVQLSLSDPAFGTFGTDSVTLSAGQVSTTLTPGTLAGTGSIIAESAGIEGGSSSLTSKPAGTYELRMRKEDGTTQLSAGERENLVIEAYDVYGNLVTTDGSTTGIVRLTESTEEFASLSSNSFTLNQGQATLSVKPEEVSGAVSVVASATGLLAGTWGGEVNYTVTGEELSEISPQMLYASVLGAPFGDVTEENYVAGWLTFNGKTQATTSLVSEPIPKKRLATIDAQGSITLPEDSATTQIVFGAGSELPVRIQWRSFPEDVLLGEVFYVLPSTDGAVSAELLTNSDDYSLEETDDGAVLLREEGAAAVKIREDGQISILDPTYSLVINSAAAGLGLAVLKNTEQILRIDFNSPWTTGVAEVDPEFDLADWDTLSSGIYLKPTAVTDTRVVTIPTGNSSLNPMGLAIIDPEEELAKEMQPSLGYMSLEAAEVDGSIGWENENKHLLLFAAGNTVGQSNLFYPSEVGIVLGDPTISLPTEGDVNELGFTTDIGTLVSASQEEVMTMMDIDYNGDDMMDVLLAYEDGRIEVLQNAKAPVRLQGRGELLFIESGISSIDKGDFNDDGLEDLLIVTDESCYEGESCIYLYENIGGGFVAENLALEGIAGKATQVEVADLNNDEFDDLVIVDENMVLYTVWNAEGTLETVDEVEDFGLNTDATENLYADLVLRYDRLEEGSVSIPILTTDLSEGSESEAVDTDLDAFLESVAADSDFELTVDGSEDTDSVARKVNQAFEYAHNEDLAELFTVTKTVSDDNEGTVEVGDSLTYTLTVENISGSSYSEFYISDVVGGFFSFDDESFTCEACSGSPTLESGDSNRPFVYGPLALSSGAGFTVTYQVTVSSLSHLTVMVGQDFYTDYKDDNYADIAVSPEGNSSGELLVYYSDGYVSETSDDGFLGLGATSYRRINYQDKSYSPETYEEEYDDSTSLFPDEDENGIPDFVDNMSEENGIPAAPDGEFDPIKELLGGEDADEDGFYATDEMFDSDEDVDDDGYNDLVDFLVSGKDVLLDSTLSLGLEAEGDTLELEGSISVLDEEISGIADTVESVVAMFTCNGGCLALPGSVAFLAPGNFHIPITGATAGFDPGTPVFGILPYLPVVCTGQMCYASQVMRLYLAPTTTLGLGLGVCLGPYGVGQCFAFNIPLLQLLGVCAAINGFITDSLSKASAFVSGEDSSAMNVNSAPNSDSEASGLSSAIFEAYAPQVSVNSNVQVPGFPSIITEWWKAQKEEFFKMLDLPDITFIVPDPNSLATEFSGLRKGATDNGEGDALKLDFEAKIDEMTGGVLGLEKWLNMAHSLPLIDIKPEIVSVRYPPLTKEEIEIITKDYTDWVEDTKAEWERFKDDFYIAQVSRDAVAAAAQQEIFNEVETVIGEAITAVEANMAILESYTEIPEKIIILRDIQAYYAKSIICYLDAILSHTAGYLKENVERIEAWMQWVVDLTTIVDGWQVLIDLSADLMDSCDKCTNQRYSGLQLLFSLFVFVPDLPVIEMPKLPDITIDVSNIQAGIDIVWPELKFVPERIDVPELPRIVLPSGEFTADLELDINIPTLPEFDLNFEIPELPGLSLPDLPSLPPPPAIPELDPTLSASLNIVSSILKIVCIIRQGFIPTPEMTLKSKIEEITERPGGIVLPFDLALEVEWPSFNFDFVKEIKISTYFNLTVDVSALYDLVDDFAEDMNEESSKAVEEKINEPLEELQKQIQAIINVLDVSVDVDVEAEAEADLESGEVGAEAEGEVEVETEDADALDEGAYLNPETSIGAAYETADAFHDHPLVQQNLIALKQTMEHLQEQLDDWDSEMPDEITLTATERFLAPDDPLLNRYDEIRESPDLDQKFLASIQGTPLAATARLRDSLISYVEDFEQGSKALAGMDSESFLRYLAQENLEPEIILAGTEDRSWFSTAQDWKPEELITEDADAAVELASDSAASAALEGLNLGDTPETYATGLFLYNAELGINTRLIDYTQEADETTNILFVDFDDDGDEDVIYSMGGDVYIKENYTESPDLVYSGSDPEETTVPTMDPSYGSVHNFKRGKNDFEEASFAFSKGSESTGYEILFYDSLDAQDSEPDENLKRLLLLEDEENDDLSFVDSDGNSFTFGSELEAGEDSKTFQANSETTITVPSGGGYVLPSIQADRLRATEVDGKVKLLGAAQRTPISANGELETADGVFFQTLEDTVLQVTLSEVETQIELPAYTLINLGSGNDRTIRVDSGEVYWIQETVSVEEQDLENGMVILPGELVSLQSSGAEAVLLTSEGGEINLDKEEVFIMDKLSNPKSPSSTVELENGAYYTNARSLSSDGTWGTYSDNVLLNPQVCADDSEPYPLVDDGGADTDGDGAVEVAIFSTRELSAEGSFDSDSEIVDAYWDLDSDVDEDGDGITNNDEQVIGLSAEIGPYEDTDPRVVTLYITDAAGNTADAVIDVEIYVPEIEITEATVDIVNGTTDPLSPALPFHLVRRRSGVVTELGSGYSTDEIGDFSEEMVNSDLISVYDAEGSTLAQFNPVTKQVIVYDENYEVAAFASEGDWPSRLAVYEISTGIVMGSFLFVADSDAEIIKLSSELANYELSIYKQVTVYPVQGGDGYEWTESSLVAHDEYGNLDFLLSQSGNITIFDDRYTLLRRDAESLEEYLILEVYDEGVLELEIWPGTSGDTSIITTEELGLSSSSLVEGGGDSLSADTRLYFEDISSDDPLYQDIAELVERDVLEGYDTSEGTYFYPDQAINRAEFTKIILSILCIIPRDEAYDLPAVFNDISDTGLWYFPFTKEAFLSSLITGYLGELNSAGMAPFKAGNTIIRAEAVKIVLEALDEEDIITLPDVSGEPWYVPYMEIAQDLSPYMNSEATAGTETYIVTAEEAGDPAHEMTRYEFVDMSVRVLQAYNCFDLDSDGDGLINYDEESIYGSDPYNPDTDAGGVDDGTEVGRNTDPLDGDDDFGDGTLESAEPGIYAVTEVCTACPCTSSMDYDADLKEGDSVFAIIQNDEGVIFEVSNEVTVTTP